MKYNTLGCSGGKQCQQCAYNTNQKLNGLGNVTDQVTKNLPLLAVGGAICYAIMSKKVKL